MICEMWNLHFSVDSLKMDGMAYSMSRKYDTWEILRVFHG